MGIAGVFCISRKDKLSRSIGAGLLGATAIITLSSFKQKLSKNKVILFGGADISNEGELGTNKEIARVVAIAAQKMGIPTQQGDIKVFNSPLFINDFNQEIVKPLASAIIENFDKVNGKIILYGYSLGGNILMHCLEELKRKNINVDLLITIDSAKGYPGLFAVKTNVPDNVKLNLNIYQNSFSDIGSRGFPNKGKNVINIDLTGVKNSKSEEIIHGNIDEYTMLFVAQVILYQMKNVSTLKKMTNAEIIEKIALYDSRR